MIDRHWNLVTANRSGALVLAAFGVDIGGSLLEAMLDPGRAEALIENWPEVAAHVIARLRTESAHLGGDPVLDDGGGRACRATRLWPATHPAPTCPPSSPPATGSAGQVFSVFTTIAQFGTAEDIALADLRIEMLFPADEATRGMFEGIG